MVLRWLDQHKGDAEGLARWMRDSLHIGGLAACRALVNEALSGAQP
jgi:hypothetical protein